MGAALAVLGQAGRWGRGLLVLGLLAGILAPGLASAVRPALEELIALLLFLAALRVAPGQAFGGRAELTRAALTVGLYQLALPLAALALLALAGLLGTTAALALALLLAAAPLAGSPNLAILTGFAPAPALRLLILGTGLLPLTVIPVFQVLPEFGGAEVFAAALKLLAVILAAALAGQALRRRFLRVPSQATLDALDGLSALTMAIVVVGLMTAIAPALTEAPWALAGWLAFAFAANFGLQAAAALGLRRVVPAAALVPFAIVAGNRNVALFLVALPPDLTERLLLFIGCYQVPMYLTPLLMRRFYRGIAGDGAPSR